MKKMFLMLLSVFIFSTSAFSGELWAPYSGKSYVGRLSIVNDFKFWPGVGNQYGAFQTYKHETWVWDKNFSDINVKARSVWYSTLPGAYLDTQFSDLNLDNFTVGSSAAVFLVGNRSYRTRITTLRQSSRTSSVEVHGQRGVRNMSLCPFLPDRWCIFATATTNAFMRSTAPHSSLSWTY